MLPQILTKFGDMLSFVFPKHNLFGVFAFGVVFPKLVFEIDSTSNTDLVRRYAINPIAPNIEFVWCCVSNFLKSDIHRFRKPMF